MEHMNHIVGYGFRPTDEEVINFYLNNKILGETQLVHNAINEINFYSFDPWDLRFQSRIKSNDYVWYFFSRVEGKKTQSRTTRSGFWKKTGLDIEIKPRRGNRAPQIGLKKVYVFHRGKASNGIRTDWVTHEYHTNSFLPHERKYVICKVEYKGEEDLHIPSANAIKQSHSFVSTSNNNIGASSSGGSEVIQQVHGDSTYVHAQEGLSMWELQSLNQFNDNLNTQQQQHPQCYDLDEMQVYLDAINGGSYDFVLGYPEIASYDVMQEDRNAYRPRESLTGRYEDESSDSDSDEESSCETSGGEASSRVIGTAAASNGHDHAQKNDAVTSETAVKKEREWKMSEDEIMKTSAKKLEKKGWIVYEDVKKKSRKNQLINVIVAFIIVFVFIIRQIISVR